MADRYRDRVEAAEVLASALKAFTDRKGGLVLGLPRGGVPIAATVAERLGLPMDIFLVRKLGLPGYRELAMGAIASGGIRVLNQSVLDSYGLGKPEVDAAVASEQKELQRREQAYRGDRPPLELKGRTVIVVDDGLATGATMRAALRAIRAQGPSELVVAVPVAPPETCVELEADADLVVCPLRPQYFSAIGQWYDVFDQISDDEVRMWLSRHK